MPEFADQRVEPLDSGGPVLAGVAQLLKRAGNFQESLHDLQGVVIGQFPSGELEPLGIVRKEGELLQDFRLVKVPRPA